jgi:hypothetical protein
VKGQLQKLTDSSVPSPSASVSQVQSIQQLIELAAIQLDALVTFSGHRQLKSANFQSLVPNTKTVHIPEQNLDPVSLAIKEQEQVAGQRVLVKNPLGQAHQGIETELHPDRCEADKDAHIGKVEVGHDRPNLGRNVPTASMIFTSTASPTPTGTLTEPPLGNSISSGDAVRETGRNLASAKSANVGASPSSLTESGMTSRIRRTQR